MKKNLLKISLLSVLAICMICTLGACKKQEQEVANPMTESDYKGVIEVTGIDLPAPAGAENVKYFYYKVDGEQPLAEMTFTLNGNDFTMRAQNTSLTSIAIKEEDITSITAKKLKSDYGDISGMNYEWASFATTLVQDREAYVAISKDKAGIINWLDAAPGVMYSLSMSKNAEQQLLTDTANAVFVPIQGSVG